MVPFTPAKLPATSSMLVPSRATSPPSLHGSKPIPTRLLLSYWSTPITPTLQTTQLRSRTQVGSLTSTLFPKVPMGLHHWPTLAEMIITNKHVIMMLDYQTNQIRHTLAAWRVWSDVGDTLLAHRSSFSLHCSTPTCQHGQRIAEVKLNVYGKP